MTASETFREIATVGMMGFMVEHQPCVVHIFDGNTLLGRTTTEHEAPQPSYNIRGADYDTISYLSVIRGSGERGWDVQVRRHC